jgi:putative acetyltransferase
MVGSVRIRAYEADDACAIARLFYETVRCVNQADYSEEQVEAWAPAVPNKQAWQARMSEPDRRTLVAEEDDEVVGFAEVEDDGHLDMLYLRWDAVGRGVGRRLYEAVEGAARASGGSSPRLASRRARSSSGTACAWSASRGSHVGEWR